MIPLLYRSQAVMMLSRIWQILAICDRWEQCDQPQPQQWVLHWYCQGGVQEPVRMEMIEIEKRHLPVSEGDRDRSIEKPGGSEKFRRWRLVIWTLKRPSRRWRSEQPKKPRRRSRCEWRRWKRRRRWRRREGGWLGRHGANEIRDSMGRGYEKLPMFVKSWFFPTPEKASANSLFFF